MKTVVYNTACQFILLCELFQFVKMKTFGAEMQATIDDEAVNKKRLQDLKSIFVDYDPPEASARPSPLEGSAGTHPMSDE